MNRGDAAAATWIFRGDASRRRGRSRRRAELGETKPVWADSCGAGPPWLERWRSEHERTRSRMPRRYTFASGSVYEGSHVRGRATGRGTMRFASGSTCVGSWKDDQIHGRAVFTKNDGQVYDGEWVADKKHGFGRQTFGTGSSCVLAARICLRRIAAADRPRERRVAASIVRGRRSDAAAATWIVRGRRVAATRVPSG